MEKNENGDIIFKSSGKKMRAYAKAYKDKKYWIESTPKRRRWFFIFIASFVFFSVLTGISLRQKNFGTLDLLYYSLASGFAFSMWFFMAWFISYILDRKTCRSIFTQWWDFSATFTQNQLIVEHKKSIEAQYRYQGIWYSSGPWRHHIYQDYIPYRGVKKIIHNKREKYLIVQTAGEKEILFPNGNVAHAERYGDRERYHSFSTYIPLAFEDNEAFLRMLTAKIDVPIEALTDYDSFSPDI